MLLPSLFRRNRPTDTDLRLIDVDTCPVEVAETLIEYAARRSC
ncbi:hypothetical protein A2U01_0053521 [Trifolium medium]|uniref:Uncharacterized protein n=1 Tax=Trifolium medium TaxID=97028 RepID=A0A392R6R7_9FABA|nr:hypothetical protein [Trifolium medium]